MRDCFDILITKYYTALSGNITYSSASVPIYDRVPNNATFPYICFSSYTGVDESNKSNYLQEVTVTIQVVSAFDVDTGGKAQSDNIADQIIDIIRKRPLNLLNLSPNFKLISVSLDDTSTFDDLTATHLIVYRNIRFRHKVEQLTSLNNVLPLCATPTPTLLTATAVSQTQINLSWTDNSGGAASFSIERSITYESGFTQIATTTAGTTTYNDTGLTTEVVYFYRVRALNSCYSTYSNIAFDCTQSNGVCADGTVVIKNSATTVLYTQTVASGGSVNRAIQNSNININATPFTTVLAEGTKNIEVKDTAGNAVGSDNTGVWEVGDATIENSDASFSTTVLAEGTKVLSDITLTQPNGSTEAKKSNINLSCTQINALADSDLISQLTNAQVQAVIESRLTCKPVNPNFQNIHSSVLPSIYATGDWRSQYNAGYINNITYSELDRVYMLDNALNLSAYTPNPFGHTKRFTGRTGSYYDEVSNTWKDKNGSGVADHATAFPNGAVYDHYTGRAFQSTLNALGSSINFADTASAAAALTTNGLTWRIPTIAEHLSSVAVTIALNTSSINPSCHFNTTTGKIFIHATATLIAWCADVHPSTTANNYCVRYTTTTSLVVSDARTTASSRGGFAVANFTTSDLTL